MSRLTRDGAAEPETKFSGTHGDKGIFIFPVQLTTSRIGNLTRLIHTLLYVMTIHTYILPRVRWHKASIVLKVVRVTGGAFASSWINYYCVHLFSQTHYWYKVCSNTKY